VLELVQLCIASSARMQLVNKPLSSSHTTFGLKLLHVYKSKYLAGSTTTENIGKSAPFFI
jgi:hypothetical protein